MDSSVLLAGGFVAGIVAALWSRVKMLAGRLASFFVVTVRIEDTAARAVSHLLWTRFRRSPFGGRRYGALSEYVRSRGRHEQIAWEAPGSEPLVFWSGWRPVLLVALTSSHDTSSIYESTFHLSFVRGTFDIDALVIEAMDLFNAIGRGVDREGGRRYKVIRLSGGRGRTQGGSHSYSLDTDSPKESGKPISIADRPDLRPVGVSLSDLGQPCPPDPLGALAFPPSVWGVVADVRRWLQSKDWYERNRIPWRFGVLLYGKPGTGKSSLIRALAQSLDLPVYSYDLSTFTNSSFSRKWEDMLGFAPCIALMEDIDAVFDGRTNVTAGDDGSALTFDCLLNSISGVADASGVLVCITTNRVERLDDAIGKPTASGTSTRPGRVDRAVLLPDLDEAARHKIATRILADCADLIGAAVAAGGADSGAQFEDRCARIALSRFWAEKA